MSEFTYSYSQSVNFPNGLAPGELANDVAGSAIGANFLRVDTLGDDVKIIFSVALTGGEEVILDGIVAAYAPSGNNTILTSEGYIELISSLADAQAIRIDASNAAGGIYINSGTGGIDMDTTNGININGGAAIGIANTAGNITLDTPALIDLNAQSGINIGNDADAAPVNIGTSTSVRTITIGNNTGASAVDIWSGSGGISLNSTGTSADSIVISTNGGIDVDASGTINVASGSNAGGAITLDAAFNNGGVTISSGSQGIAINSGTGLIGIGHWSAGDMLIGTSAISRTITMGNNTGATTLALTSGTGGTTLTSTGAIIADASGVLELNSSGGSISIGNDAVNQNMNIGTAGSRVITIGNTNASSAVNIVSGSWGLTVGNDASGGEIQIAASANAKTVKVGNDTGGSRLFHRWGTGGNITHQPEPTALTNTNSTVTIAQILSEIFTMTPSTARTITLPTAADAVAGIAGVAVNDCVDFRIINLGIAANDPEITLAAGTGGTTVGDTEIWPRRTNSNGYICSGTGVFRMRFTNVTASSETYTIYRIA